MGTFSFLTFPTPLLVKMHYMHILCILGTLKSLKKFIFYQNRSFTLIEHEQRSDAETASPLLTRRPCSTLTRCSSSQCECTH